MTYERKLTRRQTMLAKVESVVGTDASPSASTDGVLILSGGLVSPEGEVINNDRLASDLSPVAHSIGKLATGVTVRTEFRGGGFSTPNVAEPDFAPLLRAAGFGLESIQYLPLDSGSISGTYMDGETVEDLTSGAVGTVVAMLSAGLLVSGVSGTFGNGNTVEGGSSGAVGDIDGTVINGHMYQPVSDPDSMKSATIYYNRGGHLHKLLGARCDFSLSLPVGQPGILSWNVRGRFQDPVDQALPSVTLDTSMPPLAVNMGVKVGSYTPTGVTAIELAMGVNVVKDEDVNAADGLNSYVITGRTPSGSLDPKADSLANFDPWSAWKNGTLAKLAGVIGSSAGNRIYWKLPQIQYTQPGYGDREGDVTYELAFEAKRTSGDDEICLVFF